jgi:hypothetical protein
MAMRVGVAEFLEKVAKLKKPQEKVDALKANDSFVIRTILQAAFDPRIKFLLPEGEPPYKPNDLVDQENVLIRDARKLVHFVEGGNPGLKQIKREALFIEMLETVTPADAKLLVALKDKKLPFKGITADIVKEAFPEIFPKENTN